MFTGLVSHFGVVTSTSGTADGASLSIASALASDIAVGDSVAVNGVCLTATSVQPGSFRADAMNETLACTNLNVLEPGDRVNLELAARLVDRLGGHLVQGHADGVGTISAVEAEGFSRIFRIDTGRELCRYVVHKGSITVNGVSLTVSAVHPTAFEVSVIPETLSRTTLGRARRGDVVNLEVDVVAKYVEKLTTHAEENQDVQHDR